MSDSEDQRIARAREIEALIGRTVAGKYKVRRLIGRGGMGAVFEAEHETIGRKVAIKFVDREFAQDERVVGRFAREARAASAIESDHIVSVFDAGTDDGRPYIVMELLRGEDVGARLRRLRKLGLDETIHIVAQMLRGLGRAHAAGIVHRDLKPDNVLLVEKDADPAFVKIVDFGISKMQRLEGKTPFAITAHGVVLGTPLFMSPEQAQALPDVDERSDLYSVGAIFYECVAGRPPHVAETEEQIILAICMQDADDIRTHAAHVPEPIAQFVARALQRDRAARFQSAGQMLAALREVAPDEPAAKPIKGLEFDKTFKDEKAPFSVQPSGPGGTLVLGGDAARASSPSQRIALPSDPGSPSRPSGGGRAGGKTDVSWSTGGLRRAGLPGRSRMAPHVPVMLAAFVATLTGVIVTVWVVTAMRKANVQASPSAPSPSTIASASPSTTAPTTTTTSTPTTAQTPGSTLGPTPGPTPASKVASHGGGAPKGATPSTAPTKPPGKPASTGAPLDIQRDLP